jgi:hypothetical protein
LVTITAALSYQSTVVAHHHAGVVPPTSGDDVLLITAALSYEPVLKTFFTTSLSYDMTVY